MKPIPATPQTLLVAPRIIWFEPPERALADPIRFMAYAMTYARHEDMSVIRQYVSDDDFREALDHAPAGIIDPRSWAYWNSKMGRYPPPPLPLRRFGTTLGPDKLDFVQSHESGNPTPGRKPSLEEVRQDARTAWQIMRQKESSGAS